MFTVNVMRCTVIAMAAVMLLLPTRWNAYPYTPLHIHLFMLFHVKTVALLSTKNYRGKKEEKWGEKNPNELKHLSFVLSTPLFMPFAICRMPHAIYISRTAVIALACVPDENAFAQRTIKRRNRMRKRMRMRNCFDVWIGHASCNTMRHLSKRR